MPGLPPLAPPDDEPPFVLVLPPLPGAPPVLEPPLAPPGVDVPALPPEDCPPLAEAPPLVAVVPPVVVPNPPLPVPRAPPEPPLIVDGAPPEAVPPSASSPVCGDTIGPTPSSLAVAHADAKHATMLHPSATPIRRITVMRKLTQSQFFNPVARRILRRALHTKCVTRSRGTRGSRMEIRSFVRARFAWARFACASRLRCDHRVDAALRAVLVGAASADSSRNSARFSPLAPALQGRRACHRERCERRPSRGRACNRMLTTRLGCIAVLTIRLPSTPSKTSRALARTLRARCVHRRVNHDDCNFSVGGAGGS